MAVPRESPREDVVLVADDNIDAAESLGACLRIRGYHVHVAYDGLLAMDVASRLRPHIAVLDIAMPGATGHEVARWIRGQEWGRAMRLIAVTAWGGEEMKRRSRVVGIDVHLTKPASPEQVIQAFGSAAAVAG